MGQEVASNEYDRLKGAVLQVLQEGKSVVAQTIVTETLQTYHGIGRVLDGYLAAHGEGAGYGGQAVVRLAEDVGVSKSALYQALGFYRLNPKFHTCGKLAWSHYRALLSLPSLEVQRQYEQAASENGWSVRELEAQIRAGAYGEAEDENPPKKAVLRPDENLPALRGALYTYRLVEEPAGDGGLRLDLGFGIYLDGAPGGTETQRAGDLVRVERVGAGGYRGVPASGRQASFYSYAARVLEVVDGDTLWLDIDCGFRVRTRQKVRLRGIDAPELPTPEGRRAKDFVARALPARVAVTTTKPDKYDRYLADIFYGGEGEDLAGVLRDGKFLNRELLCAGQAVRFRG